MGNTEKKMKEVLMQYPLAKGVSSNFDGKIHRIAIEDLVEININGDIYYEMEYFDQTLGNNKMYTYLKMVDGVLCKVPLRKYNPVELHIFLGGCPRRKLSDKEVDKIVPQVIGVTEIISYRDMLNKKDIASKNVKMRYPYDSSSKVTDGELHEITPINVIRLDVNGFELYYVSYFDHNLKSPMITFLTKIGEEVFKIPLTSYPISEIEAFKNKYKKGFVDPSTVLPPGSDNIKLMQTLALEDLRGLSKNRANQTVVDFPLYIPYNKENPMDISDRVFRSCCRIYSGNDKDYMFDKNRAGRPINDAIRTVISQNLRRCENGESFFADIEVEIPAGTSAYVPTRDGKLLLARYIPGIHRRHIFLTPNVYKELEKPTRLCERVKIRTTVDDDRKDAPVFKDGYNEVLPITFDKMPEEYKGRYQTTFYRVQESKTVTPEPASVHTNENKDYFADKTVAELRDMYFSTMDDINDIIDGVLYDRTYAENYSRILIQSIAGTLRKLGKNEKTISEITNRILSDYAIGISPAKKGL